MAFRPDVCIWILKFLRESQSSKIRSKDIQALYASTTQPGKDPVSPHLFGVLLKKVFPNVKATRVLTNGKVNHAYEGVIFRPNTEEYILQIDQITTHPCVCKLGYFPMEMDDTMCKLGRTWPVRINGTPVLLEIMFGVQGTNNYATVDVFIFNEHMDTASMGLTSEAMTNTFLYAVLKFIHDIKLCQGFTENYGNSEGSINDRNIREKWETSDTSNFVYRSINCKRIMIHGVYPICIVCQDQHRYYTSDRVARVQSDPVPPTPPIRKSPVTPQYRSSSSEDSGDDSLSTSTALNTDELIRQLFPGSECDSGLSVLIAAQVKNKPKRKNQYSWSPRMMQLCFVLWGRSRKAYEDLLGSGCLILPPSKLLGQYKKAHEKTSVEQADVLRTRAEDDEMRAEDDEMRAEDDEMRAEDDEMRAEDDEMRAEDDQTSLDPVTKKRKLSLDDPSVPIDASGSSHMTL